MMWEETHAKSACKLIERASEVNLSMCMTKQKQSYLSRLCCSSDAHGCRRIEVSTRFRLEAAVLSVGTGNSLEFADDSA